MAALIRLRSTFNSVSRRNLPYLIQSFAVQSPHKDTFSASYPQRYHNKRQFSTSQKGDKNGVYDQITFIGAGKMAQALISPLIQTSLQPADKITVYDVSVSAINHVNEQYDGQIQTATSIPNAIDGSDLIVMAVKPQNVCKVYEEIRKARDLSLLRDDATLLSVIAGKPISSFTNGTGLSKIARSMPNTPAQIGQGVTVWCCTPEIETEERQKIERVLKSFGESIFVDDESYIDMSTSISGSGPAYIFLLMEAMIDAGVHMGFSRDTATKLVNQTILGSTLYAMETGEHPAILRNQVTSPAGTTASAIYELENGKFRTVIKDAIWACYRRSLEMGGSDSNVGPGRIAVPNGFAAPDVNKSKTKEDLNKNSHHPVEAPVGEMTDLASGKTTK